MIARGLLAAATAIVLAGGLASCATTKEEFMTPQEAQQQVVEILEGTMLASGATDWVPDRNGLAIPQECVRNGQSGVTFGHGAYTTTLGSDPVADAQRVADYWATLGIKSRIVTDPVPRVFGEGGPVNAISFSTAPTYAISVGGPCVPGNPYDFYDQTPTPRPWP